MIARFKLILVAAALLAVPLTIRAANRIVLTEIPGPGYLPSLEIRRARMPFGVQMVEDLRLVKPAWVFIGDSMLGTRVDAGYLREISSNGLQPAVLLMSSATGPAWWYLAFKNWVVPSGVKPRCTFIFFRDTNLTDTMFRLEDQYGHDLDWVALDEEPELDRIVAARRLGTWARIYGSVNRVYELDIARTWMEPAVREWFTRFKYRTPIRQQWFAGQMEQRLGLDRLRKDIASDMAVAEAPDFHRDLPSSILPELLRLARAHALPMCFVRVQRRPVNNRPPEQSPALREYVADLKAWIESNGGIFHDDTGDPEMTLDLYEDGDHVDDSRRYTEILRKRLDPLFRPSTLLGAP